MRVDVYACPPKCPGCDEPYHDEPTDDCWFVDYTQCAYYRRGQPGADPQGICSFGCRDEPACVTGGPHPTWPPELENPLILTVVVR